MKKRAVIICLLSLAWIIAAGADLTVAIESYKNFSLGYGSLSQAMPDPKAPAPGVLTALYGFTIAKDFIPYLGTGVAYTIQPEIKPTDNAPRIRAGVAGQAGFKIMLDDKSSLSFDYKYLHLETGASHGAPKTPPQSLGVGLDIKF